MLPSLRPFGERSVYLSPYSAYDDTGIRLICDLDSDGRVYNTFVIIDWFTGSFPSSFNIQPAFVHGAVY